MNTELQQKIRKPVSTLAIVPMTGSITRLGRQAYAVMLMLARNQSVEDPKTGMFSSPIHQIIDSFDGNKESMKVLKATLRSMISNVIEWQSPTDGECDEWNASALLAGVKIKVIKGENHIFWAYAPNLRHELLNPQRYAQLQRSTVSKAKSHAGLALYENCVRYKDVPSSLTSEHPWQWWVPVLRGKPVKAGSVLEYGIFKRDTLRKAIAEVNEISEITVTLREKKAGKSVTTIQFEVQKKLRSIEHDEQESQGPICAASLAKAEKMGIPVKLADQLYGKYGDHTLLKALNKLAVRLEQFSSPVSNKIAYLKSIIENGLVEEPENTEINSPSCQATVKVDLKGNTPNEIPNTVEILNTVQAGQIKKLEQGVIQLETAKNEIALLSADERAELVSALKIYASEQRWASRMIMRIEAGELSNPMIQGTLAKLHWKKTRGADWISG